MGREQHDCLFTIQEVQERLACGRTKAYELVATRQLTAVRIGRAIRVHEKDLQTFIARNRLHGSCGD